MQWSKQTAKDSNTPVFEVDEFVFEVLKRRYTRCRGVTVLKDVIKV